MKSKMIFFLAIILSVIHSENAFTQEQKDSSTVNLYFKSFPGKLDETILFNNRNVTTMKLGSRLQVVLFSEGNLKIRSTNKYEGESEIDLIIKHGERYYIEMNTKGHGQHFTGVLSQVDEATGKKQFTNEKWPLMIIKEEIEQPFIK